MDNTQCIRRRSWSVSSWRKVHIRIPLYWVRISIRGTDYTRIHDPAISGRPPCSGLTPPAGSGDNGPPSTRSLGTGLLDAVRDTPHPWRTRERDGSFRELGHGRWLLGLTVKRGKVGTATPGEGRSGREAAVCPVLGSEYINEALLATFPNSANPQNLLSDVSPEGASVGD